MAAIVGDNAAEARVRAKDEAKKNALREAVEQAAGVMVSASTLTQNSQLVSDKVFANSAGYVKSYQVLESAEDKGTMRVKVRAVVSTAALDKDLQAVVAMIRRFGNPRLMIVLQENTVQPNGTIVSTGATTTVLTDAFKADGWRMIDPTAASGKLRVASGVVNGSGQIEAKDIGDLKNLPADYVVVGQVNLKQHDDAGPMMQSSQGQSVFIVSGEYDFSIFETKSASQIGKISGQLDAIPAKDVVKKALISYERSAFNLIQHNKEKLVGAVRGQVVKHFADAEQNGSTLVVHVSGFSEYSAVQAFKKVLAESITGVKAVNQRKFESGKAEFDVTFAGTMDDLVEKLSGRGFKGKKLNVTAITGDKLELALAGK